MGYMKKIITIAIIGAVLLTGTVVLAKNAIQRVGVNSWIVDGDALGKMVGKFIDGNNVCYTNGDFAISCLKIK